MIAGMLKIIPFTELGEYGVTIGYPNDDGTITAAKDGDVLTVPDHNGKCIELWLKALIKFLQYKLTI